MIYCIYTSGIVIKQKSGEMIVALIHIVILTVFISKGLRLLRLIITSIH